MSAPWTARRTAALSILCRAALTGQGWRYGGVRGWLLGDEVEAEERAPLRAVLRVLVAEELVTAVDVGAPGQKQGLWLYRATEAGHELMAAREQRTVRVPSPPCDDPVDRGLFFLRRRLWDALHALQAAHGRKGLRLAEIATTGGPLVYEEARWLMRAGLIERHPEVGAGGRPANRYAATPLGMRVRTAAPPSAYWTQLRLHDPAPEDGTPHSSSPTRP